MQNVVMQTQGFNWVCVCVSAHASVCTCGKEGVFSLFMEFNTCYIDCGINTCVYTNRILSSLIWLSCNGKTTPLAVTVIEVPSTQTQSWLWVWRWMMALKNYWMWLSKLLLNYESVFHVSYFLKYTKNWSLSSTYIYLWKRDQFFVFLVT